jgi:citrate synthase
MTPSTESPALNESTTTESKRVKVQSRNEPFSARASTRIWAEQPSPDNPYIATGALCHGYDLFELMDKRSFVDVFYLLFRGELPSAAETQLLQTLMIALINPGPRHPATRAAMNVGVGKTNPLHILPIASAVLGGEYQGGGEVENAMRFLRKYQKTNPSDFLKQHPADLQTLAPDTDVSDQSGDETPTSPTPGFGKRHGGIDLMAAGIAARLVKLEAAGKALEWGDEFAKNLAPSGSGWFITGVAAAVFADLGFQPKAGGALFQLLGAPGLVAHGLEVANKPITAMPYVSDANYTIER